MKLILIYGPMAVGKLTVAEALKDLCDEKNYPIKIFHNHHTVDLISEYVPSFTPLWFKLNGSFRLQMYEACAEIDQNLITTLVFAKDLDEEFVYEIVQSVEKHGGSVVYVQLTAQLKTLFSRLNNESRQKYRKLKSVDGFKSTMEKYEIFSAIPDVESLTIDTDRMGPENAALQIYEKYLHSESDI